MKDPLAQHPPSPGVLVVDDDEGVQAVARSMLEDHGFRVLTAGSGLEGLRLFRAFAREIDAVLLDLTMPVVDGTRVLAEIHRLEPSARVIVMSGYSARSAAERLLGQRIAGFIQKPFRSLDLIRVVHEVLA